MIDILPARKVRWLHICLIIAAILLAYYKVFHAPFSSWDDDEYVVKNPDIQQLGLSNIRCWFSHFYVGNYAPITLFTYALDFCIGHMSPIIYHVTNVVIHVFNALLLYHLIRGIQKNETVALFTVLLFALAPVQTEGVSWISERKTLLCIFFYLLALLQYLGYLAKPMGRKLLIVYLLCIAAMLSKAIAVAIPLSMLAIDVMINRDLKARRVWLEKIPIFMIAVIIGLVAIKAESAGKFLGLHPEFGGLQLLPLAGFTYVQYIKHLLAPGHLSLYYTYPDALGFWHYFYLIIAVGIGLLAILAWRKGWNILCGSILFYSFNIALVLQFIQFSFFLMVDHYSYIAGIGVFFPVVYYGVNWFQKIGKPIIAIVMFSCVSLFFFISTFLRNDIWLSEINFTNSLLADYPNSAVAHFTVGAMYLNAGNYKDAEIHINKAVELDPRNYKAWYDKGVLNLRMGRANESLEAFNKCLSINHYSEAYFNRALLYMSTGRPVLALADAEANLELQPRNARSWYIKAYCIEQQGNIGMAIEYYTKAILFEGNEPLFYIRRGLAYTKMSQSQIALDDFNKAIALDPKNGEAYYYRGRIKGNLGQSGCVDLKMAVSRGYKVPAEIMQQSCGSSR